MRKTLRTAAFFAIFALLAAALAVPLAAATNYPTASETFDNFDLQAAAKTLTFDTAYENYTATLNFNSIRTTNNTLGVHDYYFSFLSSANTGLKFNIIITTVSSSITTTTVEIYPVVAGVSGVRAYNGYLVNASSITVKSDASLTSVEVDSVKVYQLASFDLGKVTYNTDDWYDLSGNYASAFTGNFYLTVGFYNPNSLLGAGVMAMIVSVAVVAVILKKIS